MGAGRPLQGCATGCVLLPGSGLLFQELGFKLQANGEQIVLPFQGRNKVRERAKERSIRSGACRGFGDGPGLAFVALGRLQPAEASSLSHLRVCEVGGGAMERLANEKETPHGLLNSARGEKGTKGKVRSSRAREVVCGNQSLLRSWESGSVF